MEKIHIGYIQGFHGLKGELKIKNKFEEPDLIFKKDFRILLNEEEHIITSSRLHKGFYLIQIDNINDINKVEKYKGYDVFINRNELNLNKGEFLLEDLIGLEIICENKNLGVVNKLLKNGPQVLLQIEYEKKYYIPYVKEFVERVEIENKKIYCQNIEGLIL